MNAYRWLLGLLALALLAALAAWFIGSDPGYVLVQRGRWTLETTLVFAIGALIVLWVLLTLIVWMLRWPLLAMVRRSRRRGRLQYASGALALAEGRTLRAETLMLRASRLRSLRLPALLGAYAAARQRGETKRQGEILAKLAAHGDAEIAAIVLRARAELEDGRAGTVIELLQPLDQTQRLPPAGAATLAQALAARGRARESLTLLSRVRRSQLLSPVETERFEARIVAQALTQASDPINLQSLWAELNRAQRRDPLVALAFAQRAAALHLGDNAALEIEQQLKRHWNEELAIAWSRIPASDHAARLRIGEAWLAQRPSSPGLLLALGRLCRDQALWGKAEAYLRRALGAGAGAPAWEELGHCLAAQGDAERASRAYANALALARGEEATPLTGRAVRDDLLPIAAPEERDEHGVPRLPSPAR